MMKSCHSCGIPIQQGSKTENYCDYCVDENGKLKPKQVVQEGIAHWLSQWAPVTEKVDFMKRAEYYMRAMPAWTDSF